jgi:RNA-binding protein YhbY
MQAEIQLGKNGITDNFIETLKHIFENHESVRLSVLKSARDLACTAPSTPPQNRSASHNKEKIKEYSAEILEKLGKNYTARIIGFKIIIQKWRKNKR